MPAHPVTTEALVRVEWLDTHGCPAGWQFEDEAEFDVSRVMSVGYLIRETDEMLVLAPHVARPDGGERRQLAGVIAIPRCQVVSLATCPSSEPSCPASESVPSRPVVSPSVSTTSARALCRPETPAPSMTSRFSA